jgi:hypothetical protein
MVLYLERLWFTVSQCANMWHYMCLSERVFVCVCARARVYIYEYLYAKLCGWDYQTKYNII